MCILTFLCNVSNVPAKSDTIDALNCVALVTVLLFHNITIDTTVAKRKIITWE